MSDLVEAKRGLQELLASKDRFLASVAHELRTPLTSIVGFAHELKDSESLSPAEQAEFVGLIAQNSVELAHLIEDILVVARAEIGEVNIEPQTVDLGDEVAVVLRLLSQGMSVHLPERPVLAHADPARVRQILRNLVSNACRYGGEDVSITLGTAADSVFVDVSDNGPEIAAADVNLIFEPYQKPSESPSLPGSIGLGLPVSRALAQAQGGDVTLRRESGRNVFRLLLSAAAATADRQDVDARADSVA